MQLPSLSITSEVLTTLGCYEINNGSQTCSWLDHIAMSDGLSESLVDCHTLQDVACSDHCAIAVAFYFDQLPMTHTVERPKNKHINWKFEDVGLKRQFYERLDNMLDPAPLGLRRSTGTDANRPTDLLLRAASKYLGNLYAI